MVKGWIGIFLMYILLIPSVAGYFAAKYTGQNRRALLLKGMCTFVIFLAAAVGAVNNYAIGLPVSAGLLLGLVGDIVISFSFVGGMLFFAIGHICYLVAFFESNAFITVGLPVFIFAAAGVILFLKKSKGDFGKLIVPVVIYGTIILLMLSVALASPLVYGAKGVIVALAGLLFTASDIMLAQNVLSQQGKAWDIVSLCLYYAGQSLFAVAVVALL